MAAKKKASGPGDVIVISAPSTKEVRVPIIGTSNYVSNAFSQEAKNIMENDMARGDVDKARGSAKKRPPKDFDAQYEGSLHRSTEGWYGIPVIAFRAAMVRAASLCGVEMTRAKMCVFVLADGNTPDGVGLVRITRGEPEQFRMAVRNNGGGTDIRARGRFAPGWEATVRILFDEEFLSAQSVVNLLARAGVSVGVGAGRPFSTMSVGQGWGTFSVPVGTHEVQAAE
jgi:hypothetical protein